MAKDRETITLPLEVEDIPLAVSVEGALVNAGGHEELERRLVVAARCAKQHHLSYWNTVVQEHKKHATFKTFDDVMKLEYGFTCSCTGEAQEHRVSIRGIKEMIPELRNWVVNTWSNNRRRGNKKARRDMRKAQAKAKALLFKYLTREQKQDLRATNSFTVRGADGNLYRIENRYAHNVILETGTDRFSLCVVAKEYGIPVYDLLLAQKTYLELDPATFLKIAKVYDTNTHEGFETGEFLVTGIRPIEKEVVEHWEPIELEDEVLDNPRVWVEGICRV